MRAGRGLGDLLDFRIAATERSNSCLAKLALSEIFQQQIVPAFSIFRRSFSVKLSVDIRSAAPREAFAGTCRGRVCLAGVFILRPPDSGTGIIGQDRSRAQASSWLYVIRET
jgi:hypothetical protein